MRARPDGAPTPSGLRSRQGRPRPSPSFCPSPGPRRCGQPCGGIEFELAEIGSASSQGTGAVPFQLSDSYGQWALIRHGPEGVVH